MSTLILCLFMAQMLRSSSDASAIPDNSVIWTARENGLFYFDHNDTMKWLFEQATSDLTLTRVTVSGANAIVGFSYHYSTQQIIISDSGYNWLALVNSVTLSGTPIHIGTSPGIGQLTIDWLGLNVYWTDANYGWIAMKSFPKTIATVNSFDRGFRLVVDTFLDRPTGIVVYPLEYYLFWADAGVTPKIERSDLVGGNRTVLVWQGLISPTCLTIDNQTKRLFWSDQDRGTIEYIFFNGSGRAIFVSESGYDFYGIAIFQDRIIYTAPSINRTGVYTLSNSVQGTRLNVGMPFYYVDVFDKESQPRSPLEPCDSAEFDCDQICVHMEYDRGATCFCEDGYNLVGGKQCEANSTVLERHILFTLNTDICATSINLLYSISAPFKPDTDCTVVQHDSAITKFALDMNDNYVFFTDGNRIYKQVAYSSSKTLMYTAMASILDIDYDWKTRELFWCEEGNKRIMYKSTDNSSAEPLFSPTSETPIKTLAVDPHNNHVYWISQDGAGYKLYTWNRGDGSVSEILTTAISDPTDIEYDRINDRLLWNDDKFYGIIRPDGTGARKVDTYPDSGVRHGIAVYKKLVLCTIQDEISHFDIFFDGRSSPFVAIARDINLSEVISDVHVFDSTTQLDVLGPCEVNNNDCDHLCFPGNVPTCACYLGYELADDGKTCTANVLATNFTLVLDGLNGFVYQFHTNNNQDSLRVINMADTNRPVDMTFDQSRDTLTWVDGQSKSIRQINILQGGETTLTGSDYLETSKIVVDESTGDLFFTKDRTVYVKSNNENIRELIDSDSISWTIKSIALSVDKRKLGWIEMGNEAQIKRSDLDGSNVQTVVAFDTDRIASPEVIRFDPVNGDNIYWCDSVKDKIEKIDSNLQAEIIHAGQYHFPVTFDVDETNVYYVPMDRRKIFVIDKVNGREVSSVIETPLLGAIYSIYTFKTISFPPTTTPVPTSPPATSAGPVGVTEKSSGSDLPTVPIAAGAGGGVVLLVIVIVVIVCLLRKRNEKMAMRRPSNLPHISEVNHTNIQMNGRHHDYDGLDGPSPDPPPRPLTAEEEKDGGVYHELDDLVVDLPPKDDGKGKPQGRRDSNRYSRFPEVDYYKSKYITPTYNDATPKPDYNDFDAPSDNYLDLTESSRDRLGMSNDRILRGTANSAFSDGDDGYLLSSSLNGPRGGYGRHERETRDFSDGSAPFYGRDPYGFSSGGMSGHPENSRNFSNESAPYVSRTAAPPAHMGGWHGSRSGASGGSRSGNTSGSTSAASRGYAGFIPKR